MNSEGVIPSGEVMPMPGVWVACALAVTTLARTTIADKMHVARIKFGLSSNAHANRAKLGDRGRWRA